MNTKEFFKRWKRGIMSITPIQMIRTEIIGYIGSIIGLLLSGIILIFFAESWYLTITIFFIIIIQFIGLIGKYQQFNTLKTLEKEDEHIPEENVVMVNDGEEKEGMISFAIEQGELINNILKEKETNENQI